MTEVTDQVGSYTAKEVLRNGVAELALIERLFLMGASNATVSGKHQPVPEYLIKREIYETTNLSDVLPWPRLKALGVITVKNGTEYLTEEGMNIISSSLKE